MMEHNPAVVDQMKSGHIDVVNAEPACCQEGACTTSSYSCCSSDELLQPADPPPQTEEWLAERSKVMEENDIDRILSRPPALRRKLLLDEAPEFEQRLGAYKEVKAGESLTFTGTYRAFPTPTVKWYKDEEELQDAERRRFDTSVDQAGTVKLSIYHVETKDEGVYKCKVENQEGVASTTGYLCVIAAAAPGRRKPRGSLQTKRAVECASPPSRELRPIVEQSSMEAQEEEVCRHLGPSPLSEFIDVVGRRKRFTRQAPGPIVFFHESHRQAPDGADADVDNVFGVDSDSPSSPSEQLTPRLIALPSFTSSPSYVKSQVIAPTPAENFRSNNSNDDSDYDSDTTPRAMIVEPSNLISMSLDSEATLWEDFLAGGTGFQQRLSGRHDGEISKPKDDEPSHSNKVVKTNPLYIFQSTHEYRYLAENLVTTSSVIIQESIGDVALDRKEIENFQSETFNIAESETCNKYSATEPGVTFLKTAHLTNASDSAAVETDCDNINPLTSIQSPLNAADEHFIPSLTQKFTQKAVDTTLISQPSLTFQDSDKAAVDQQVNVKQSSSLCRTILQNKAILKSLDMLDPSIDEYDLNKKNNSIGSTEPDYSEVVQSSSIVERLNIGGNERIYACDNLTRNEYVDEVMKNGNFHDDFKNGPAEVSTESIYGSASGYQDVDEYALITQLHVEEISTTSFNELSFQNRKGMETFGGNDFEVTEGSTHTAAVDLRSVQFDLRSEGLASNITAKMILHSFEPSTNRQIAPVLPVSVAKVIRSDFCKNYANDGCSDDDSLIGWLLDCLDASTLQFYLLFVTISMAIASASEVPCAFYLVAATALIVIMLESCRTVSLL